MMACGYFSSVFFFALFVREFYESFSEKLKIKILWYFGYLFVDDEILRMQLQFVATLW